MCKSNSIVLSVVAVMVGTATAQSQYPSWKQETQAYYQEWIGVKAPTIKFVDGAGRGAMPIRIEDHVGKRTLLVSFDAGDFVRGGPPVSEVRRFVGDVNKVASDAGADRFSVIGFTSGFYFIEIEGVVPEEFRELRPKTDFPIVHLSRRPTNDPYSLLIQPGGIVIDRNGIIVAVYLRQMSSGELAEAAEVPDWKGEVRPTPLHDPWEGKPPPKPKRKFRSLWKQSIPISTPIEKTPDHSPVIALGHGEWYGDGQSQILAIDADGFMHVLSDAGKERERFKLPFRPRNVSPVIECARLASGEMAAFQAPAGWPTSIPFVGRNGKLVYEYNAEQFRAMDSLAWADLDGNGCGDFIVGFNGTGGIEVIDCNNQPRWTDTKLRNVWRAAGLGASRNQPGIVICSSADGLLRVYDSNGDLMRTLTLDDRRVYNFSAAEMNDKGERQIMSQWDAEQGWPEYAAVCDLNGQPLWKYPVDFPDDARVDHKFAAADLTGNATKEWIAISQTGEFIVLDAKGQLIAVLAVPNQRPRAWTAFGRTGKPGLLVTSNSAGIEAHEIAN